MYEGVDICFVIDTTSSMAQYFDKVRIAITRIIDNSQILLKNIRSKCEFQFAVVDYRDHPPEGDYVYHKRDFMNYIMANAYVKSLTSGSGGDIPEAVLDGLDAACDLSWRDNADHLLFHILDAPPHGRIYHTFQNDKWIGGCPCNKTARNVLQRMKKRRISYHVLHCSNYLNMMITEFKNYIDVKTLAFDDKITFEDVIAKQVHQQLIDTEITLKRP
jgi:hypothetical protein